MPGQLPVINYIDGARKGRRRQEDISFLESERYGNMSVRFSIACRDRSLVEDAARVAPH